MNKSDDIQPISCTSMQSNQNSSHCAISHYKILQWKIYVLQPYCLHTTTPHDNSLLVLLQSVSIPYPFPPSNYSISYPYHNVNTIYETIFIYCTSYYTVCHTVYRSAMYQKHAHSDNKTISKWYHSFHTVISTIPYRVYIASYHTILYPIGCKTLLYLVGYSNDWKVQTTPIWTIQTLPAYITNDI